MVEIFKDVSEEARKRAEFIFDMAMRQKDLSSTVQVLNDYTKTCVGEEQEFVEFYFNYRLEKMLWEYSS